MTKQSRNFMAEKIATIHHHSASQREELVDPLAELVRIINEGEPEPKPRQGKASTLPRRRRGPLIG